MKIRPILFNTEMVRAVKSGEKTVTRRLIKPQPRGRICFNMAGSDHGKWAYPSESAKEYWGEEFRLPENLTEEERSHLWTPPCHTDDILYVRETWARLFERTVYKADCNEDTIERMAGAWKPSIHLPREAARIWLRVKHVTVERLQDINERGPRSAQAEGFVNDINLDDGTGASATKHFADLWDSTLKPAERKLYGWDANPWVWLIEFEKCEKPEEKRATGGRNVEA